VLFNKIHQSPFQLVLSLPMSVADGTRIKGVEANIKKLYQMIETAAEENRAERARASEAMNLKFDALQFSIT